MNAAQSLDRTLRLLQGDLFPSLTLPSIARELTTSTVVVRADQANLETPSAQTALATTFVCLAQLGVRVVLDLPEVSMRGYQPPLRGRRLRHAFFDLGKDLAIALRRVACGQPDATILIGDTPAAIVSAVPVLRIGGDDWSARVSTGVIPDVPPFRSELPFGAAIAGAACAAEVMRIILGRIARTRKVPVAAEFALGSPQSVSVDLPAFELRPLRDVGAIDVVSAGAITNAFLFSLLRVGRLAGSARIFDSDIAEITNLNRYSLLRRSLLGEQKVALLADFSTHSFRIDPIASRLDLKTLKWAAPLRDRVLVGVDDIPSRWLVQERCAGWLCVAGTSHFTAMVSEHTRATPCAACLHPRDDPNAPAKLPTISFTSMIAGALQAYRLLASVSGVAPANPTLAATFNLGAERAVAPIGLVANPACPIACNAIETAA